MTQAFSRLCLLACEIGREEGREGGRGWGARGSGGELDSHVQPGHVATARACPVCVFVCVLDEGAGRGGGKGGKGLWARMQNYSRALHRCRRRGCSRRLLRTSTKASLSSKGPRDTRDSLARRRGSPGVPWPSSSSCGRALGRGAVGGRPRSEITGTKKVSLPLGIYTHYVHSTREAFPRRLPCQRLRPGEASAFASVQGLGGRPRGHWGGVGTRYTLSVGTAATSVRVTASR